MPRYKQEAYDTKFPYINDPIHIKDVRQTFDV